MLQFPIAVSNFWVILSFLHYFIGCKGFTYRELKGLFPLNAICLNASAGRVAPGFGVGALEELDAEDEDVYGSGLFLCTYIHINTYIYICINVRLTSQPWLGVFPPFIQN